MNLQPDSEHAILRDSAEKFLGDRCDYRFYQKTVASEAGWNRDLWDAFAELGWLGVPFAERLGGTGGGAVEIAILMENFGKFLVIEPYLATVVLSGGLIAALGSEAQQEALLKPMIAGRARFAFAHEDTGAPATATRGPGGYALVGAKKVVLGAPMADAMLISARIGAGLGVFVVAAGTPGVVVRPYRMVSGERAADIELAGVTLPADALLGGNTDAGAAIDRVIEHAIAALSADAVGAIAAMVQATVDYTKTRVQFGQPIASFQAIQHRLVAMKVKEEEARASALFATLALDGPAERRARAVAGAKAKIGRAARSVHQEAIQLHGAIGTTAELSLGAYAKRLVAYEILFGATHEHLSRYGALIARPELAAEGLLS
ncbi:MAG TPA: acyl-CoA dehydrogenase [Stellaceae bacterium]|nr:acyl-CoA dehydrogenase [Stellaceae bacterium]